jgi:hypothetical protein
MNTTELEALDLSLFKVCYPHEATFMPVVKFDEIHYGSIGYMQSVNRFTQDIQACFSVLVPEMNRRGWIFYELYQLNAGGWRCGLIQFGKGTASADGDEPAVAICLAADKAIKSQNEVRILGIPQSFESMDGK